jgi:hypothetical protein
VFSNTAAVTAEAAMDGLHIIRTVDLDRSRFGEIWSESRTGQASLREGLWPAEILLRRLDLRLL